MSTLLPSGRTLTQRFIFDQLVLLILLIGVAAVFSLYVVLPLWSAGGSLALTPSQASSQARANAATNQDVLSDEWLKQYHDAAGSAPGVVAPVVNDVLSEEWLRQNGASGASTPDSRDHPSRTVPDNYIGLLE